MELIKRMGIMIAFMLLLMGAAAAMLSAGGDTVREADSEATETTSPEPEAEPAPSQWGETYLTDPERAESPYAGLLMSDAERDELAGIIYLEARGECMDGQIAVAVVVFNRVLDADFPDNVHDVIHECEGTSLQQFQTVSILDTAEPTETQYDAIDRALAGDTDLPVGVLYFGTSPENDHLWGQIGNHYFCYGYDWREFYG